MAKNNYENKNNLNGVEREVILLLLVREMIDSMVNLEMMNLLGEDPNSEIRFKSSISQQLFGVLLVDFIKIKDRTTLIGPIKSFLLELQSICSKPSFDSQKRTISALSQAATAFDEWLKGGYDDQIWLPSIDRYLPLSISRYDVIYIYGNLSKHNILDLSIAANKIRKIFSKDDNNDIDIEDVYMAMYDIYDYFDENIFNYYASAIAEFLNNIRWEIYNYLRPQLERSIVWEGGDPPKYSFTYPEQIENVFAQKCYWDLMNAMQNEPYIRRFRVSKRLKLRY
jgi:hypothetical protein